MSTVLLQCHWITSLWSLKTQPARMKYFSSWANPSVRASKVTLIVKLVASTPPAHSLFQTYTQKHLVMCENICNEIKQSLAWTHVPASLCSWIQTACSLSLSLSLSHTHTHSLSLSHTHTHTHRGKHTHSQRHAQTHTHTLTHTEAKHTHTPKHTEAGSHLHMCARAHTHTHTHTRTLTHTHTHTHTHMCTILF